MRKYPFCLVFVAGTPLCAQDIPTVVCTTSQNLIQPSGPFYDLTVSGALLYSVASDAGYGKELHYTDGTPFYCGSEDLYPGPGDGVNSNIQEEWLLAFGNGVLMVARASGASSKLFRYEPGNGVQLVYDFTFGWENVDVDGLGLLYYILPRLTRLNDSIACFAVNWSNTGVELWRTNGTTAGTYILKDIEPGFGDSDPRDLHIHNGTLYFTARTAASGRELWRSDGTEAGTTMVLDIEPGPGDAFYSSATLFESQAHFTSLDETLFFTAFDTVHGQCLWRTDGTAIGSVQLPCDLLPLDWPLYSASMTAHQDAVWYNKEALGQIWRSDGSVPGTMVVDPADTMLKSHYEPILSWNGAVYYGCRNIDMTSFGICRSDGTPTGTGLLSSLPVVDATEAAIWTLVPASGHFFFFVLDPGHPTSLYRSDGTAAGTTALIDTMAYGPPRALFWNDHLYFTNYLGQQLYSIGQLLRLSDGDQLVPGTQPKAKGLTLFPNPANTEITLSFTSPSLALGTPTLFDATGRITSLTAWRSGPDVKVAVGSLASGPYHLEWMAHDGTRLGSNFVKE